MNPFAPQKRRTGNDVRELAIIWLASSKASSSAYSWLFEGEKAPFQGLEPTVVLGRDLETTPSLKKAADIVVFCNDANYHLAHPRVLLSLKSSGVTVYLADSEQNYREITWPNLIFVTLPFTALSMAASFVYETSLMTSRSSSATSLSVPAERTPEPSIFDSIKRKTIELAAGRLKSKESYQAAFAAFCHLYTFEPNSLETLLTITELSLKTDATLCFERLCHRLHEHIDENHQTIRLLCELYERQSRSDELRELIAGRPYFEEQWVKLSLKKGRVLRSKNLLSEALKIYDDINGSDLGGNDFAEQLEDLHYALWAERRFEEALHCVELMVKADEKCFDFFFETGRKLLEHDQLEAAEKVARKAVEHWPTKVAPIDLLCDVLQRQKRYEEALSLVVDKPNFEQKWCQLASSYGRSLRDEKQLIKALDIYGVIIKRTHSVDLLQLDYLLNDLLHSGLYKEAHQCANYLLSLDDEQLANYVSCGERLCHYGQIELAEHMAREGTTRFPDEPSPSRLMARILSLKGNEEELLEHLRKHCQSFPNDYELHLDLAPLLIEKGFLDESEEIARNIVEESPENLRARETLFLIYLWRNELDRAEEEVEHLYRLGKDELNYFLHMATIEERKGQYVEATRHLIKAVELAPDRRDLRLRAVRQLWQKERRGEAEKLVADVEGQLRQETRDLIDLAKLYVAIEKTKAARELFEKAAKEPSDDGEAAYEIAELLFNQGRCDEAVKWLKRAQATEHPIAAAGKLAALIETIGPKRLPEAAINELSQRIKERGPYVTYQPSRKKIVAIVHSLCCGGAESFLSRAMTRLSRGDLGVYDISMLVRRLSPANTLGFHLPTVDLAGIPVYCEENYCPAANRPGELNELTELIENGFPKWLGKTFHWYVDMLLQERPEAVWALDHDGALAGLAATAVGIPTIILRAENMNPDKLTEIYTEAMAESLRYLPSAYRALASMDGVRLANVCQAGARDYEQWLELSEGKFEVLENGLDPRHFEEPSVSPDELRNQWSIPLEAPVIGSVFRLTEQKCPLLWLDVASRVVKEHPETHFVHIGGGELEEQVLVRARELGISERLHLIGRQDDLAPWYRTMDVFFLVSSIEGLPHVLLEAQAAGIPVVCPDVGGCREAFVPEETGFLATDRNVETFAHHIDWILDNPQWAKKAAPLAQRRIKERFTMEAALDRILELGKMLDCNNGTATFGRLPSISVAEPTIEAARKSCILCASVRTGSSLLCVSMINTRLLGLPREFYLEEEFENNCNEWNLNEPDRKTFVRASIEQTSTPNGIFTAKIMWSTLYRVLAPKLAGSDELLDNGTMAALIKSNFPKPYFIWLRRYDKVAQAISFYRAKMTDCFYLTDDERDKIPKAPPYDYESIEKDLNYVMREEEGWRSFFIDNDIRPLVLHYEDFTKDLKSTLLQILGFLGEEVTEDECPFPPPGHIKLADETSLEWGREFRKKRLLDKCHGFTK